MAVQNQILTRVAFRVTFEQATRPRRGSNARELYSSITVGQSFSPRWKSYYGCLNAERLRRLEQKWINTRNRDHVLTYYVGFHTRGRVPALSQFNIAPSCGHEKCTEYARTKNQSLVTYKFEATSVLKNLLGSVTWILKQNGVKKSLGSMLVVYTRWLLCELSFTF